MFTENDLKIVPYTGLETLIFKDSVGDSLTMQKAYKTGRFSLYNNKYYEHYFDEGECVPNFYFVERNFTAFCNKDTTAHIETDIYIDNPFADSLKKHIAIEVSFQDSQHWYFSGSFFFNSNALYDREPQESFIVQYNDSLIIGSKVFKKVYTLQQLKDPYGLKNLQYVYYSLIDGVVGFKTKDGHLLFLYLKQ